MRIISALFVLIIFFSCNNPKYNSRPADESQENYVASSDKRLDLLPEPDKEERLKWENNNKKILESCFLRNPDTSVAAIKLNDANSTLNVLGKDFKILNEKGARSLNHDKSQFLNVIVYPGSSYNSIDLFEVGYTDKILKDDRFLTTPNFKTEKNVRLGMPQTELVDIFGDCYKVAFETTDTLKISYRIELPQDTKNRFLARHNMPIYYAAYDFVKSKLYRFEFGFEYP